MKRLIVIGIAALIALTIDRFSYAGSIVSQNGINIHLAVDSNFGMQIWDSELEQPLPEITPGESMNGSIHILANSNFSDSWTINASSDGLVGENQAEPDTLPVNISTYEDGVGLKGTFAKNLELTNTAQPIYISGAGEQTCEGLLVGCIFSITTEPTTKEDIYSGTIVLSMTE